MKTIVCVWTHEYCNFEKKPNYAKHGLGDLIRGTVGILSYCEKRGYECIIDISLHPLSQLLLVTPHKYSQFIQENRENVKHLYQYDAVKAIDKELEDKDLAYFFTAFDLDLYDIPSTPTIKQRIREILTPNEILSSYINSMEIPYSEFAAFHFRLGDDEIILNQQTANYSMYISFIQSIPKGNCILFSDSNYLKELAKPYIYTIDSKVAHIGFHTQIEDLKNTMFEFFLLTRANRIHTFSTYPWVSGFVKIINFIYDIPLIDIKG
jgi:hypothetical protein